MTVLRFSILILLLNLANSAGHAQQRLSDPNALAWFNAFGTFSLNQEAALYTEYQFRREGPVENWQQSLARIGIQRKLGKRLTGILGYGHIATYPYGEYAAGPYPAIEHRLWQQLSWDDATSPRISLNHRFRIEQRFIQKIPQREAERRVDGYSYMNRVRYQLRATFPLSYRTSNANAAGQQAATKTLKSYLAAYDEIFIGFGPDVVQNIFDQNRIGLLIGHNWSPRFRAEAGYFNQTVQQGGEIANKEVFQYNHGFILNAYYTLPATAASAAKNAR